MTAAIDVANSGPGWHGWGGGWGWWWLWVPFTILFWLALGGLVIWLATRRQRPDGTARAILAERYARGELSAEEYRERLAQLR